MPHTHAHTTDHAPQPARVPSGPTPVEPGPERRPSGDEVSSGLENVIAAETRLSEVDGQRGRLILAGYAVEDIAPLASFEDLLFLFWTGRRASASEHAEMQAALAEARAIPPYTRDLVVAAAGSLETNESIVTRARTENDAELLGPTGPAERAQPMKRAKPMKWAEPAAPVEPVEPVEPVAPMDALRMGVSSLPSSSKTWNGIPYDALVLTATLPTMLGTFLWARRSQTLAAGPVPPLPSRAATPPLPSRAATPSPPSRAATPSPPSRAATPSPPSPLSTGRHAEHVLHQLFGEPRPETEARAIETYLNTVIDHGFNASTFTARVIMSTRSDLVSAVSGAIGALKGPLHGGAPGPALDTVLEIQQACGGGAIDSATAERILREKLERGERLMGFGHRVYRVRDPRADVLGRAAERFYEEMAGGTEHVERARPEHTRHEHTRPGHTRHGRTKLAGSAEHAEPAGGARPAASDSHSIYAAACQVESIALRLLAEYKPHRKLQTNVEFYTALLLHGLGVPTDVFSSVFALGRVGGWIAHGLEQKQLDKLIRPRARYAGAHGLKWSDPVD